MGPGPRNTMKKKGGKTNYFYRRFRNVKGPPFDIEGGVRRRVPKANLSPSRQGEKGKVFSSLRMSQEGRRDFNDRGRKIRSMKGELQETGRILDRDK